MIRCDAKALAAAIKRLRPLARDKHIPVLRCLLASASNGLISLRATDMEQELTLALPCEGEVEPFCVDADMLQNACSGAGDALISVTDDKLIVKSGGRWKLPMLPARDFPVTEEFRGDPAISLTLTAGDIKTLLAPVIGFVAKSDDRPYLMGFILLRHGPNLRCVAADGHRIAYSEIPAKEDWALPVEHGLAPIIPPRAGQALLSSNADAEISVSKDCVRFAAPGVLYSSRNIDAGEYPNYERALPANDPACRAVADRKALIEAVSAIDRMTDDRGRAVAIEIRGNRISFGCDNPSGSGLMRAPAEIQGEAAQAYFSGRYLIEALGSVDTETVHIALTRGGENTFLAIGGAPGHLHTVTSMRAAMSVNFEDAEAMAA